MGSGLSGISLIVTLSRVHECEGSDRKGAKFYRDRKTRVSNLTAAATACDPKSLDNRRKAGKSRRCQTMLSRFPYRLNPIIDQIAKI
jgi:hypothetical protein